MGFALHKVTMTPVFTFASVAKYMVKKAMFYVMKYRAPYAIKPIKFCISNF